MQNKSIRVWQALVILLVVCNIALVATIWCRPGYKPERSEGDAMPRDPKRVKDMIIEKLAFSPKQKDTFLVMAQQHHEVMKRLDDSAKEIKATLFDGLKNAIAGPQHTDSLAQAVAGIEKAKILVTYTHFSQVRALCDDRQKPLFDDIVQEAIRRVSGPQGDGHGQDGPPHGEQGHHPPGSPGDEPPPPPPGR